MSNVFVSYNRDSQPLVQVLAKDIKGLGHTVWFDRELSGGQSWWDQILEQIRQCDVFVFALAQGSLESVACAREYEYAFGLNKPILPILISEGVSTNLLPDELSQIHFVDYQNPDDKSATLSMSRALNSIDISGELPKTLPDPPEVPLSYLGELASRLRAPSMSEEEQKSLVFDVKESLRDPATAEDGKTLLKNLKKRPDLLAKIEEEINQLLRSASGPKQEESSKVSFWNPVKIISALVVLAVPAIAATVWFTLPKSPPVINSFTANTQSVTTGTAVTLSWDTTNAETLLIKPGQETVEASGSLVVQPSIDTQYQLIATNSDDQRDEASVRISVTAAPEIAAVNGSAGYLSDSLHGNLTASGIRYDKDANTASKLSGLEEALGKLSYGTKLKVTNRVSGDSVVVKLLDSSGSSSGNRIINLSTGAFKKIAELGAGRANVSVQIVD